MEEFDLRDLWNQQEKDAGQFFEGIAPEVERMARQSSKGIIAKVLRNSRNEMYLTIGLGLFVLFYADFNSTLFWAFVVGNCVAIPISIRLYTRMYHRIKDINQRSIKLALQSKIQIMQRFVKRLQLYTYILLPFGCLLGILANMTAYHIMPIDVPAFLEELGIQLFIALPLMAVIIWFFNKKYIYWLYGKHLEELERLYASLEEE